MRLAVREVGDILIIDVLKPHVITENWDQLERAALEHLAEGKRKILINLDHSEHIDSSGLGTLVTCYKAAQDNSAKLALLGVHKKVYDILVMTRLIEVFRVFCDEADALKSFR